MRALAERNEPVRVTLLYACPGDGFDGFEQRLLECASGFGDQLALCRLRDPAALASRLQFATFVSATQPTIVLMCRGDVIAELVGNLPRHEIRVAVSRALLHHGAA
jgi:hypothetical protein